MSLDAALVSEKALMGGACFAEERQARLLASLIVLGTAIWVGVDASKRD
jgi:hypothetical protein